MQSINSSIVSKIPIISLDTFIKLCPYAKNSLLLQKYPYVIQAMERFEINTLERVSAFIAQVLHESGNFRYIEELASGKAYEDRKDLGNLEPRALEIAHANHSTTGPWFKGHGDIQITGYYNHLACGAAIGVDAVSNPRVLCTIEYSTLAAAWFWKKHGCNSLADIRDFHRITKVINGGYTHEAERIENYNICNKVLGLKEYVLSSTNKSI
jgi:putative chitinase